MEYLLGNELYTSIIKISSIDKINEIRIRINSMPRIITDTCEYTIQFISTPAYISNIINRATYNSKYAHEQEISDGYIEYKNGIRIGLIGKGKINDKKLIAFSSINSICIRIPHNYPLNNSFFSLAENFQNTLIIGPPFSGKTTFIRALSLEISKKYNTVIIDERCEICGNICDFSNKKADIVQGIPKSIIFEKIIRSMSPEIIVCDELFYARDIESILNITKAGILCLASYHAYNLNSIELALKKNFSKFIILSSKPHPGSILSIINHDN